VSVSLAKDRVVGVGNDPYFRSSRSGGQRQDSNARSEPC
jgi:hypothetical protein